MSLDRERKRERERRFERGPSNGPLELSPSYSTLLWESVEKSRRISRAFASPENGRTTASGDVGERRRTLCEKHRKPVCPRIRSTCTSSRYAFPPSDRACVFFPIFAAGC